MYCAFLQYVSRNRLPRSAIGRLASSPSHSSTAVSSSTISKAPWKNSPVLNDAACFHCISCRKHMARPYAQP